MEGPGERGEDPSVNLAQYMEVAFGGSGWGCGLGGFYGSFHPGVLGGRALCPREGRAGEQGQPAGEGGRSSGIVENSIRQSQM